MSMQIYSKKYYSMYIYYFLSTQFVYLLLNIFNIHVHAYTHWKQGMNWNTEIYIYIFKLHHCFNVNIWMLMCIIDFNTLLFSLNIYILIFLYIICYILHTLFVLWQLIWHYTYTFTFLSLFQILLKKKKKTF